MGHFCTFRKFGGVRIYLLKYPVSGVRNPESLNQSPELALTDLLRLDFLTIFHILSLRPLGPEFGHLFLPS